MAVTKQLINSLQVFRGFAAFAVVCHHAAKSTEDFVGSAMPEFLRAALGLGYLGVDFFFVLSGFIIMYTHMDDGRSVASVRRYTFKRLIRLFPPYLPVSLAMVLFYTMAPGLSAQGGRDFSIWSSLFLIPADRPPALNVAWTLVHELIFYAMFMSFFVSARIFSMLLAVWAVLIVVVNSFSTPVGWVNYLLSPLNIEFMFGVLAARYASRPGFQVSPRVLLVSGAVSAMSALAFISPQNLDWVRVVFAFGLALIVLTYVLRERVEPLRWPWLFLVIGNASYSIYLIHNPLLSITQRTAGKLDVNWLVALLAGVCISLLAGYVYSRLIEMPASTYLRGWARAA